MYPADDRIRSTAPLTQCIGSPETLCPAALTPSRRPPVQHAMHTGVRRRFSCPARASPGNARPQPAFFSGKTAVITSRSRIPGTCHVSSHISSPAALQPSCCLSGTSKRFLNRGKAGGRKGLHIDLRRPSKWPGATLLMPVHQNVCRSSGRPTLVREHEAKSSREACQDDNSCRQIATAQFCDH